MTLQFLGYALPGTVMFFFGVGWCWGHAGHAASRQLLRPASKTLRLRQGLRWPRVLRRHPVQGVLKLIVSLVGIVGSLFAAYPDGSFQYVGDVPFATVYLFFALSGVVDVLSCYCPHALSRGHARASLALAFLMEAFLFHHAEVDEAPLAAGSFALQLLVGVMSTCAVTTALCGLVPWPYVEAVDAVRCGASVVHGTWLYHCGLLLYWPNPTTSSLPSADASITPLWVTLSFAWHCASAASLLIVFLVTRRSLCATTRDLHRDRTPLPPPPFNPRVTLGAGGHALHRGASTSPASHHHSCLLCSASASAASYHRTGSLV